MHGGRTSSNYWSRNNDLENLVLDGFPLEYKWTCDWCHSGASIQRYNLIRCQFRTFVAIDQSMLEQHQNMCSSPNPFPFVRIVWLRGIECTVESTYCNHNGITSIISAPNFLASFTVAYRQMLLIVECQGLQFVCSWNFVRKYFGK